MSTAFQQNKKLGRGINIANALEAPKEGSWGVYINDEYFPIIKAAGFTSIRLPTRWSAYSKDLFPYTINEEFFNRIDGLIKAALESNLSVIINVHHFDELFNNPAKFSEKFLLIWKQIAIRYKDYSDNLFFELLNEPHFKLTASKWNSIIKKAVPIIRSSNPTRTILIGPANWNKINGLKNLLLPVNDQNIIVTFHYYSPFTFTHQGAEWFKFSNFFIGKKWQGTKRQLNKVSKDFNFVKKWSIKHNIPINLGEFGAYNKADLTSRTNWTNEIARTAEKYNFSWIYWEFGAGFGAYNIDKNKWNSEILKSLIPDYSLISPN